ncbi:MAG: SDR family oxidoreductase [Desulfobacterales bacterium]|nr:SDR family oxidoreductase [Deltaproteobacteria bacterium]NNK97281.1 SDR family oxidoreductase [Desulfobacterales bacterium]
MTLNIIDSFSINGKVAVITGGGGELCGAMATALGSIGTKVAILDLNREKAEKTAAEIEKAGGNAIGMACNVLSTDELESCHERVCNKWGAVDLLIPGAGGNDPRGSTDREFFTPREKLPEQKQDFFDLDLDGFRYVFDLNFLGTFLTIKIFSKSMVAQRRGSILNISSMSALTPLTKVAAYSAAKAAVSNFTQWLAVHFSQTGVRVNAIAPGFFMTEQLRFLHVNQETGELSERARKVIAHTPLGRYGEPDDLLGAVIWLLSDASKFVTGVVVPIDGGFSAYTI